MIRTTQTVFFLNDSQDSSNTTMPSPPTRALRFECSDHNTPDQDACSPLPSISERLAYLRPSRELLEFYRQKVAQFDSEHEDLLQMLEKYKSSTEEQHKLQWEVQQRESEIAELQKALSDMQVCLFQEREQALRLYAENDRLKIRELEDRKKIQHLLALVGPDMEEVTYFHQEPPHKVTIPQSSFQPSVRGQKRTARAESCRKIPKSAKDEDAAVNTEQFRKDNQSLLLQVEALKAQMEEQTRLAKEQVEALLEDRQIHIEEGQVQHQRDQDRITALTDKLHRTQNLLYESTRDLLQVKSEMRAQEKGWMTEKDKLLRELDVWQERLREGREGRGPERSSLHLASAAPERESHLLQKEELKALQEELKQVHRLADMYRDQCVTLEAELAQIREEGDVGREIFKERSDKIAKRLHVMTQRYEALEKRRAMEVEGFRTDIKHLRQKLKDVEKQLFKVALNVGPNQDLAVLHEVRQTSTRTKKVQSDLKALKAKIYGLENELRYC
ncbi:coiled-coil domain-containing protein 77 [Arapaima gigas]